MSTGLWSCREEELATRVTALTAQSPRPVTCRTSPDGSRGAGPVETVLVGGPGPLAPLLNPRGHGRGPAVWGIRATGPGKRLSATIGCKRKGARG